MAKPAKPPTSFEDALAELESIVQAMENEPLALEVSLERYQRGIALVKQCQERLAKAEAQIRILDGETLAPFENGGQP